MKLGQNFQRVRQSILTKFHKDFKYNNWNVLITAYSREIPDSPCTHCITYSNSPNNRVDKVSYKIASYL